MHTYYAINLMLNIWHDATRDTNCQFRLTLGAVCMYWCFEGGFWCSDVPCTHNSEKCEIVKPPVFTCKTFNRTLLFGWKLSGRWMSQWRSPVNGSSCSKHTSSAEQSQLGALNYCDHSFDINENHSAFSNLYTRYYKHICRWQKKIRLRSCDGDQNECVKMKKIGSWG